MSPEKLWRSGLGPSQTDYINMVGRKIQNAIIKKQEPVASLKFGMLVQTAIGDKGAEAIELLASSIGDEEASRWLSELLVQTGMYAISDQHSVPLPDEKYWTEPKLAYLLVPGK